ncbi:serine hydrolase domain-containing protein [Hydrocarboniphaga sp.]|uniref:serine hydrolase domain-containing protein n=1 Tax=Hydrocarboniphaga sp. TaxID=2033016 RepID=UPI003D152A9C
MQANATTAEKLDALFQPWNRSDAPGLVVGVAQHGQPIYRRGFGLASVEHGTLNTPQTRMRIGSTSKQFVVLAALLLAEDRLIDIDAPIRQLLPELSGPAGDPTVRQLMQHTGGLRDPYDLPGLLFCRSFPVMLHAGAGLELSQRFGSANDAPGERMVYNNNGYHLLSLAVERVGQMPLAGFLQQRIFDPLGLRDTQLLPSDMSMIAGIASLHLPQADGRYRRGLYPSEELLGSGGMVSSIDDMLRWLAHLRSADKLVGRAASWQQMLQPARYSSGASGEYGLGLICETYRGVGIVHHAGAVLGGTCQMLSVPEHALDIIVMFNRMDGNASAMALKVIDSVLGDALPAADVLPIAEGRDDVIGRWYSSASHRLFGIVAHPQEGQPPVLALSVHQQLMGVLKTSEAGLRMNSPAHGAIEVLLAAGIDGKPGQLAFTVSGHRESFTRLPDAGPAAADLAADLVGRYRYDDFDRELAVILEDGALYLDLRPDYGQSRLRLTPFSTAVCGFELGGTFPIPLPTLGSLSVERRDGRVTGLWLNSARTRDLWLQRT